MAKVLAIFFAISYNIFKLGNMAFSVEKGPVRKDGFAMKKFHITVNGTAYEVDVEEIGAAASAAAPAAAPAAPVAAPAAAPAGGTVIACPMPGTIIDIKVAVGDAVAEGQILVVFEAMKMENEIVAPCAGTVASINVMKGDSVDSGAVLLSLN